MRSRSLQVLVVNQYYPPDTSATAVILQEVARAFENAGHDVTLLVGRPSYAPTQRMPWRLLAREKSGRVCIERLGSSAFDRGRMGGRVFNYLSYAVLALGRGLGSRADLVLAMTDPPLAPVVGALVAGFHRVPLVVNVRDLHPDMAVASGMARPGLLTTAWDAVNRWALRRATSVVVLGEDMRRRTVAKGVRGDRVTVIRDGAAPPAALPADAERVRREVRGGFRFVVMHAGNLGHAGDWTTLLAAAAQCADEDIGFVFAGDGVAAEQVHRAAAGMANVRVIPPRSADEVPALLAAGDVQVVTLRDGLDGLVVPSKLYPLLRAGRPVLAVVPEASDVARIVREGHCGWVAAPGDPAAVARAIREASNLGAGLTAVGARAATAGLAFDRSRLMLEFIRVVEEAAT